MAKPVSVTISHDLGREAALERIRNGFDRVSDGLGFGVKLDQEWQGDTLHFGAKAMGQSISGELDTFDDHVRVTLVLPALLAGMADMIMGKIQKQSALLLEKK
ncbi:MAG: polyhydroxyalkanoic acid system family protein [Brucellaceae bacterium]|nr:polyhydroxyalkanoic acid system family protein [Brucellaceae bacterium]